MNNEEAKFILQGYRPDGSDAGDAAFSAALEQAKLDPALGQWFERTQRFDAAISAKLAEVKAPAGLREAILAGGRVTVPETTRRSWWRMSAGLAVAASIAVLLAVGLAVWPNQADAAGSLAEFALLDAKHSETHGGHGSETKALQATFSEPGRKLGNALPVDFDALQKGGCRTVSFKGHELLEVCFNRDGAWFHCYIARRSDFPALVAAAAPVLGEKDGAAIASWADSSHIYMIVSKTGYSVLEGLL